MFRFLLILSVISVLVVPACRQAATTDSVEGDQAALLALVNATNGSRWKNNKNWLSDLPLSIWYGVTTNAQGRVVELNLFENQLSGSIPPELGNLSNLEVLVLAYNQLSGSIPPELGNLSKLEVLILGGNSLSGPIPPELGNLSKLEVLILGIKPLWDAALPGFSNLPKFEYLLLYDNPHLCMPSALQNWKFYDTTGVAKCVE